MHLQNVRPTLILRTASYENFLTHNYFCNKEKNQVFLQVRSKNRGQYYTYSWIYSVLIRIYIKLGRTHIVLVHSKT